MKQSTEKIWAMVTHFGMAISFGGLGALIIFLVFKDKSKYVAHHAHQAMWFFFASWAVMLVLGLLGPLSALVPVVWLATAVVSAWGSFNALKGVWFEYPLTSKIARRALH